MTKKQTKKIDTQSLDASLTPKEKYDKYREVDPHLDIPPALLNDVDIIKYVESIGMIEPFDESQLNGVTYEVKLCGKVRYWQYDSKKDGSDVIKKDVYLINPNDDNNKMADKGDLEVCEQIELVPNSITYVTLEPEFRLPAYLIARFNLKIKLIYRGLLLGTGPIVDPGFQGRLSIPLHNLTENSYVLRGGETIIAMEFTKISPNQLWDHRRSGEIKSKIKGFSEDTTKRDVFSYTNRALDGTSNSYIINAVPRISREFKDKVTEYEKENKLLKENVESRINKITIGGIISIATLVISLLIAIFTLLLPTWQAYNDLRQEHLEYQEVIQEIEDIKLEIDDIKLQIEKIALGANQECILELQKQLEELERRLALLEEELT